MTPAPAAAHEQRVVEQYRTRSTVVERCSVDLHFSRRGHGEEYDMEARWITRRIPPSALRVLDIGCGIGALFPWIGVSRAVGIDLTHEGLRCTSKLHPNVRLACADGVSLPFGDASFDIIAVQHVIEHLPDPDAACAQWRRVVHPGGRLLIVTPNSRFADPAVFDDPTHQRLFNRRSLKSLLRRTGWEVESLWTLGLPWFRHYQSTPGGWRIRRSLLRRAEFFARFPGLRGAGQSLCCMARRSES